MIYVYSTKKYTTAYYMREHILPRKFSNELLKMASTKYIVMSFWRIAYMQIRLVFSKDDLFSYLPGKPEKKSDNKKSTPGYLLRNGTHGLLLDAGPIPRVFSSPDFVSPGLTTSCPQHLPWAVVFSAPLPMRLLAILCSVSYNTSLIICTGRWPVFVRRSFRGTIYL